MGKIKSLITAFYYCIQRDKKQVYSLLLVFLRLFFRHPRTAFSMLFYSLESLNSIYKYEKKGKLALNIAKEKSDLQHSKALFILGSGPSVNKFSDEDWAHIQENDSWGFNVWFCNAFVPSVYIVQSLPEPKKDIENSFQYRFNNEIKNILKDKKHLYNNTKFIVRGDSLNKHEFYNTTIGCYLDKYFKDNVCHIAELSISSRSAISPTMFLEELFRKSFFNAKKDIQLIPKFGSTITELISLALILGHKKIVLCGIDMNDGGHFYDNESYFNKYPVLRELSEINNSGKNGGHEHMDRSVRPFTIKEYIIALNSFAKKNFGASIYVMNESSALYPEIEKYKPVKYE